MRKYEVVIAFIFIVLAVGVAYVSSLQIPELPVAREIAQISFWSTATLVAWLTYINARTGFLQPVRTELIKAQLVEFQRIQSLFIAKSESELREQIELREFVQRNVRKILNDYCRIGFGTTYKSARQLITVGDSWHPLDSAMQIAVQDQKWTRDVSLSKDERMVFWKEYRVYGLIIPKSYREGVQQIRNCMGSPLLPESVEAAIEGYVNRINGFREILKQSLDECVSDLPLHYPSQKSLGVIVNYNTAESWLSNHFYRKIAEEYKLAPLAEKVVKGIREYLPVDRIVKP